MGSLPRAPRLSPAQIVALYLEGQGRGMIGLKAGIGDSKVKEILLAAGVELRTSAEGFKAVREMYIRRGAAHTRKPAPRIRTSDQALGLGR